MTTTNTTPTPEAIAALAWELATSPDYDTGPDYEPDAAWILTRFVRREEHERKHEEHVELQIEYTKLCAELSQQTENLEMQIDALHQAMTAMGVTLSKQRCDGSGNVYYRAPGQVVGDNCRGSCPSCPACKPDATPTRDPRWCGECDRPPTQCQCDRDEPNATPPNTGYRRCCGSDQDKSHEEWCDNKPDATPKAVPYCAECERRGLYMSRDPEMYRGDDTRCRAHQDGGRTPESVSTAGERDCNATPAGEDESPAFRPAAPVRGCPRHTPYWCYPCDDCSEILRRKHEAEAAAPVHVSLTPERMSLLEHHCSDADFATIGKLRDESYAAGYQAGRDDAVRLNVQQVSHVVELGSETLRTVVAAQLMGGLFSLDDDEIEAYRHGAKTPDHEWAAAFAVSAANALLTHLHEREMK